MRRYQLEIKEINFLSIDAVAMYPSMNFPLVNKSISYFTRNLPKNHQSTFKLFLKLIVFGMSSTWLAIEHKYFDCFEKGITIKDLAIGGYKPAFLGDLVASYLFEKWNNQFN